jgi:hypothetical protein
MYRPAGSGSGPRTRFELEHDILICESIRRSSYRWHGMSEAEVAAYRTRLTDESLAGSTRSRRPPARRSGDRAPRVREHRGAVDVNRRRVAAGRPRMPLLCFAHGTELKMHANEQRGDQPEEFPLRFLPFMQQEKIFDFADLEHGVDGRGDLGRAGRGVPRRFPSSCANGAALPQRLQPDVFGG